MKVMAMKILGYPPVLARASNNKYFTIVSNEQGKLRAVVLRVGRKRIMRPYFCGNRIAVRQVRSGIPSFDEFQ